MTTSFRNPYLLFYFILARCKLVFTGNANQDISVFIKVPRKPRTRHWCWCLVLGDGRIICRWMVNGKRCCPVVHVDVVVIIHLPDRVVGGQIQGFGERLMQHGSCSIKDAPSIRGSWWPLAVLGKPKPKE